VVRVQLPCVLSCIKELNVPRHITLAGWGRAFSLPIEIVTNRELNLAPEQTGLSGSPTRVRKISPVLHTKQVKLLDADKEEDIRLVYELLKGASGSRDSTKGKSANFEGDYEKAQPNPTSGVREAVDDVQFPAVSILVLGLEQPGENRLEDVTGELIGKAMELASTSGTRIGVLVVMEDEKTISQSGYLRLADVLYFSRLPRKKGLEVNSIADIFTEAIRKISPEIVLGPATFTGRAYMPLIAAALDTGLTADCTGFEIDPKTGLLLQTRPAFGGHVMATIICAEKRPQMSTVRPHVFSSPDPGGKAVSPPSYFIEVNSRPKVKVTAYRAMQEKIADISNARIIFAGGRGVGGRAGFQLLSKTAANFGGAIGASRSAVEAGWATYSQQVGQTGRTVQPVIYLAFGISGSVQHLVGMHDSDTIIAVNRDGEAPIFSTADYGFVTDYRVFLNALKTHAEKRGKAGAA
jgi:electron transfer flavoprotein alpha subunit